MNVLITGSKGYIARNLINLLPEYNFTLTEHSSLDLIDQKSVDSFFTNKFFDIVIHTAVSGGKRTQKDDSDCLYENILMSNNLMKNKGHFDKIISFGSGAAFDRNTNIHEFSNIEATNSSQKLYQELIRVEEDERNRPIEKSGMPSIHSLFSGANDPQAEMKLNGRIYKRKIGVVSMFPIPNTKADILEFLSLAVSEGGKKIGGLFSPMSLEEREYIKAWRAKADQVVVKARFSLKDDKKLVEEINTYAKQLEIK